MIMKSISLLVISLILSCGWALAQNDKISFNETEHDFGKIGEKDGKVSFDFLLKNNGTDPVVLTNVTASCGCTTPKWTREPIEKGKTGTITVTYDPLRRVGSFTKTVSIFYSGQSEPLKVRIKGEVLSGEVAKKNVDVKQVYPVAIGDYLLKTKDLDFGQSGAQEAKTIRLDVYNNSDNPVNQKVLKLPKYLRVVFNPEVIPPKTAATIDVVLNVLDENTYGNLSGNITMVINGVNQNFPYSATIIDNFSQWSATRKANAGKVALSAAEINFGNLTSGSSRTLKISNSGKSVLNIRSIHSSDPAISVSKTHFSINPGEIDEVKVNANEKNIKTKLATTLTVISDDPNQPISEVSVLASK